MPKDKAQQDNASKPATGKTIAVAVGRRRRSVATVKLYSGNGEITVNNQMSSEYFPGIFAQTKLEQPLAICQTKKYSVVAKVGGGGKLGQLDATILGLSRCLSKVKSEYKALLREAGLLTRDSRQRQRRMVGMGGKARRKRQSPKR